MTKVSTKAPLYIHAMHPDSDSYTLPSGCSYLSYDRLGPGYWRLSCTSTGISFHVFQATPAVLDIHCTHANKTNFSPLACLEDF